MFPKILSVAQGRCCAIEVPEMAALAMTVAIKNGRTTAPPIYQQLSRPYSNGREYANAFTALYSGVYGRAFLLSEDTVVILVIGDCGIAVSPSFGLVPQSRNVC
jgi:hypothetical protein